MRYYGMAPAPTPRLLRHASGGPEVAGPGPIRNSVAVVLSTTGTASGAVLPILAGLGVTTIDRPYDPGAPELIEVVQPQLTIVLCDASAPGAGRVIGSVAHLGAGAVLVLDLGAAAEGKVAVLRAGADVALSFPEDAPLLPATLRALLRRLAIERAMGADLMSPLKVGQLTIDPETYEVRESGELLPLTPTEYRVLYFLAQEPGVVRSCAEIMAAVQSYPCSQYEAQQLVKVYIKRIRRKLVACRNQSVEILNSRAVGYRLRAAAPVADSALAA